MRTKTVSVNGLGRYLYDKVVEWCMTDNIPFNLPPKGVERLEAQLAVIVPSTKGIKEQKVISKMEMNKRVDEVRRYLSRLFGGYTSVNGVGGYVMRKGNRLVKEDVVIVTSFGNSNIAKDNIRQKKLLNKMKRWAIVWSQETMGMTWENDFIMVSRK